MPVDIFAPKAFSPVETPEQAAADDAFTEPYKAWKEKPGPDTSHALLGAVRPVINEAIRSYGAGSQGSPNLATRAKMMALNAMGTYDPAKGSLRTHLLSSLRGLQRVGAGEANIITMPEQVALDRQQLQKAEKDLHDQLGRAPSDAELADSTGLSRKRLGYIRQGQAGLNTGTFGVGQRDEAFMPATQIAGQSEDDAWADLVYHDLSPTEQVVMQHTLGMGGHPVLNTAEIAKKLGVSPGMVSNYRKKIQTLLDKRYESELGI